MTMTRKAAQTGSVRWLKRPSGPTHFGRFAIAVQTSRGKFLTTEYDVAAILDAAGEVLGFGLAKDNDDVHTVDFSPWYGPTCTCGDSEFRGRECKHIGAIRAAMHEAGITIPAPKPSPAPVSTVCEFDDP